ncbi:hypothetical protein C8R47DRAFT_1069593 [Mycena vitilis]|nr:hypothetical protein C8R47DRAFT_1069593 [Mycena vitilis]
MYSMCAHSCKGQTPGLKADEEILQDRFPPTCGEAVAAYMWSRIDIRIWLTASRKLPSPTQCVHAPRTSVSLITTRSIAAVPVLSSSKGRRANCPGEHVLGSARSKSPTDRKAARGVTFLRFEPKADSRFENRTSETKSAWARKAPATTNITTTHTTQRITRNPHNKMLSPKKILAKISNAAKAAVRKIKIAVPRVSTQAATAIPTQAAAAPAGAPPIYGVLFHSYEDDVDPLPAYVRDADEDDNNYLPAYDSVAHVPTPTRPACNIWAARNPGRPIDGVAAHLRHILDQQVQRYRPEVIRCDAPKGASGCEPTAEVAAAETTTDEVSVCSPSILHLGAAAQNPSCI